VFADGRLAGVIDFDYCSPGPRLWDLAYLAFTLVPLTGALDAGPFTGAERVARIGRLLSAYGSSDSSEDLVSTLVVRLRDLADFSDRAADDLANPDLHRHAAGYRADASRLAEGRLA
jgi:Ser/Thr protein kinase RdoA (MazF antagonist)